MQVWFCEDREDVVEAWGREVGKEEVRIKLRAVYSLEEFEEVFPEIDDGDVVSLDSQMPFQANAGRKSVEAGIYIASRAVEAGKRVFLNWHSGNARVPALVEAYGCEEYFRPEEFWEWVRSIEGGRPELIEKDVRHKALQYLRPDGAQPILTGLWCLCDAWKYAKEEAGGVSVAGSRVWFAPLVEELRHLEGMRGAAEVENELRGYLSFKGATAEDAEYVLQFLRALKGDRQALDVEIGQAHNALWQVYLQPGFGPKVES